MITHREFDWSLTERKVVVFSPNWGRGDYIRHTTRMIKTCVPKKDWIVLVANDGIHDDLSDLESDNVVYFTFDRENKSERNGCFIRNFVIKRVRSQFLFSKDPEIIVAGSDFISNILTCGHRFYRLGSPACKVSEHVTKEYMAGKANLDRCIQNSRTTSVQANQHQIMHFGYSMLVNILQNMHGYDEDYSNSPYCEDRDIFYRFRAQRLNPFVDQHCFPVHLWHEMKFYPNTPDNKRKYEQSQTIFASKDPKNFIRNTGPEGWGEGKKEIGCFHG